ncbi:Uracil-DNA glycosylase [compost metagenome]
MLPGVRIPPSLRNIYKELSEDLGVIPAAEGDLTTWAEQGVLLLNTVLTVREGEAGSHQGKGWESFTDAVIQSLNRREKPVIFILWGNHAQKKRRNDRFRAAYPF